MHQLWRLPDVFPDLVYMPLLKFASQHLLMPFPCLAVASHFPFAWGAHFCSDADAGWQPLRDTKDCANWMSRDAEDWTVQLGAILNNKIPNNITMSKGISRTQCYFRGEMTNT